MNKFAMDWMPDPFFLHEYHPTWRRCLGYRIGDRAGKAACCFALGSGCRGDCPSRRRARKFYSPTRLHVAGISRPYLRFPPSCCTRSRRFAHCGDVGVGFATGIDKFEAPPRAQSRVALQRLRRKQRIFAAPDRATAEAIIEQYDTYWMEIVGTRGFKGKKAKNARTQFKALFSFDESEVDTEPNDSVQLDTTALYQLEQEHL